MRLLRKALSLIRPQKPPLTSRIAHLKRFVSYQPSGGRPPYESFDASKLRIVFIIPDFKPGAGGHMTIFRVAHYLETFGHQVRFFIQNPTHHTSGEAAKGTINENFQPFEGQVDLFEGETPDAQGDALIATDRYTCYPVQAMEQFIGRFYFVQDFEPSFYPAGAEALLSEATYHLDFDCLCAGDWLSELMSKRYGRWAMSWPLAYDDRIYTLKPPSGVGTSKRTPLGEAPSDPNKTADHRSSTRIALYARYVTPRRAVELAILALDILYDRGVRFEVDFFGWPLGKLETRYPYRDHGVLNAEQLAELYRASALGVVFSATNHSLVNKEMMACGLPVVDLDLETVRSIFPPGTLAMAKPTPDGIADELERLLTHPQERDKLARAGLDYVADLSWETSSRQIEDALKTRLDQKRAAQHA